MENRLFNTDNKHIDCNWLLEIDEDCFRCCDARSPNHGKSFHPEKVRENCCDYFHHKQEKLQFAEAQLAEL